MASGSLKILVMVLVFYTLLGILFSALQTGEILTCNINKDTSISPPETNAINFIPSAYNTAVLVFSFGLNDNGDFLAPT